MMPIRTAAVNPTTLGVPSPYYRRAPLPSFRVESSDDNSEGEVFDDGDEDVDGDGASFWGSSDAVSETAKCRLQDR